MCTFKSLVTVEGLTSFPSNITGGKVDILLVSCGTPTKMSFVLSSLVSEGVETGLRWLTTVL